MARNASSEYPSRSILFTANTTCRTPSRAATVACRLVCVTTPLRASTSTTTASAVDMPVTVFRVYCSWPGQSARMKERAPVVKYR